MPACEEYLELISRYVDNDLSADEAEALFEHLAHCPGCSEALSSFDELRMMMRETTSDVPEQLRRGVMASVDAAKKRPFYARYRFTAVAAVFALVILGLSATPLSRYFAPQTENTVLADEAASTPMPSTTFSAGSGSASSAPPAVARETTPSAENSVVEEDLSAPEENTQAQPEAKLMTNDTDAASEPVEEPAPEAVEDDLAEAVDPALLPHTPYDRTFASYLVFTAAEAPEVLYSITSDQIIDHVIYYIVSPEQLALVQSALLEDGMEVSVISGDPESEEALLILTIEE